MNECKHADFERVDEQAYSNCYCQCEDCCEGNDVMDSTVPVGIPDWKHGDYRININFIRKCKECGETRNYLCPIDPFSIPEADRERLGIRLPETTVSGVE